ncbi:uncharacterized protein LOC111601147 isoform X2 [Drosophila hydei]|uniref:Uncharacterized protein LOC111601147 isoform X2 n=1 Tax=Drosophila hydei TaxID=7224 RepID=A0A6J1M8Z3_DROHY|nr:uncharacterized protein LOC111601147 isoform X2 [Drosophila hydei]
MIAYMKKFLFCIPLRVGNIFIGYFCIVHGFGNVWIVILKFSNLCKRLIWVWFLQSQINIIAGIVLLAVTFNIVVKLSSLIIELVFYLLLTSSDLSNNIMFAYSLGSIIINLYFVIVIFSFYHETIRA